MQATFLKMNFKVPPIYEEFDKELFSQNSVEDLFGRVDRMKFAEKGGHLKKQIGEGQMTWIKLSDEYLDQKRRLIGHFRLWQRRERKRLKLFGETGKMLKLDLGGYGGSAVISEKIWIRTGKVLRASTTIGNGEYKIIDIDCQKLRYRVFFSKTIDYWKYVDHEGVGKKEIKRPLFHWTSEDRDMIQKIAKDWLRHGIAKVTQEHNLKQIKRGQVQVYEV